jgi:pilus assembly protein Flp/PilA
MFRFLARLGSDTNGATAIEYGLIIALIFLAMMGGVGLFGQNLGGMWNMVSNTVSSTA